MEVRFCGEMPCDAWQRRWRSVLVGASQTTSTSRLAATGVDADGVLDLACFSFFSGLFVLARRYPTAICLLLTTTV